MRFGTNGLGSTRSPFATNLVTGRVWTIESMVRGQEDEVE
jgi:hypothetical protein